MSAVPVHGVVVVVLAHSRRKRLSSSSSSTPCAAAASCSGSAAPANAPGSATFGAKSGPLLRSALTSVVHGAGAQQQPARRARILPNTLAMEFHAAASKMQQRQ